MQRSHPVCIHYNNDLCWDEARMRQGEEKSVINLQLLATVQRTKIFITHVATKQQFGC
jgi:hypothetical protein